MWHHSSLPWSYVNDPSPCVSQDPRYRPKPKPTPKVICLPFTKSYWFVDGVLHGEIPPYQANTPEQATRNHTSWCDLLYFDIAFRGAVTSGDLPIDLYDTIRLHVHKTCVGSGQSPQDETSRAIWTPPGPLLSCPIFRSARLGFSHQVLAEKRDVMHQPLTNHVREKKETIEGKGHHHLNKSMTNK